MPEPLLGEHATTATSVANAPTGIQPWSPPSIDELLRRRDIYEPEEHRKAWSDAAKVVKTYSDEMIIRWNAEIDTYLVYAGLFSAILTAFNVQSYLLLQPTSVDPSLLALQQISAQLSSFSTNSLFINSTYPALQRVDSPPPPVPTAAIWLNTLWFSSLILSLSSASIGIMVKQWINEYSSGISSSTSHKAAQLRQYRLNGLIGWHVRHIVMLIPILLQLALALFLAGILVLLWTLDSTVAIVASLLVAVLAMFMLFTIILPLIEPCCCYLSPQTLALYAAWKRTASLLGALRYQVMWLLRRPARRLRMFCNPAGAAERILDRIIHSLRRYGGSSTHSSRVFQTWRGREQAIVSGLARNGALDVDLIVMAYDTTMDPNVLATAAVCVSTLEPTAVIECFERLHAADERHFGTAPYAQVALGTDCAASNLWTTTLVCLLNVDVDARDQRWTRLVDVLEGYLRFSHLFPRIAMDTRHVEGTLTTLSSAIWDVGPHPQPGYISLVDTALRSLEEVLGWAEMYEVPVSDTVICCAAAASDRCLQSKMATDLDWTGLCDCMLSLSILFRCSIRVPTGGRSASFVRTEIGQVLRHLSAALRQMTVSVGVRASSIQAASLFLDKFVHALSGNHAHLGALVTLDLISALEDAVAKQGEVMLRLATTSPQLNAPDVKTTEKRLEELKECVMKAQSVGGGSPTMGDS